LRDDLGAQRGGHPGQQIAQRLIFETSHVNYVDTYQ
jgi:hypothetical protein